jgi:hypothetical protein
VFARRHPSFGGRQTAHAGDVRSPDNEVPTRASRLEMKLTFPGFRLLLERTKVKSSASFLKEQLTFILVFIMMKL